MSRAPLRVGRHVTFQSATHGPLPAIITEINQKSPALVTVSVFTPGVAEGVTRIQNVPVGSGNDTIQLNGSANAAEPS